ncbi:hypothetical protein, partial [Aeromonas veronii]
MGWNWVLVHKTDSFQSNTTITLHNLEIPLQSPTLVTKAQQGVLLRLCPNYVLHGAPQRLMQTCFDIYAF